MKHLRLSIAGLMGLVLFAGLSGTALRFATEAWAGVMLLLTLAFLTAAILGVVYRRGAGRATWLGAVLFGWGYMILVSDQWWDPTAVRPELITTGFLDRLYPVLRANPGSPGSSLLANLMGPDAGRNSLIMDALSKPVSMPFANETPLEDVLKYVRTATSGPGLPAGIPIYVDPVGLTEAEKTMASPITLSLEGVKLSQSLRLLLRQLDLTYIVKDGMMTITNIPTGFGAEDAPEFFRKIGHYLFALLAACLGGLAGYRFWSTGGRREPAPAT